MAGVNKEVLVEYKEKLAELTQSEELIASILGSKGFATALHKFANSTHQKDIDATAELIMQVLNRFKSEQDDLDTLIKRVNGNDELLGWKYTNAGKTAKEKYYKRIEHELNNVDIQDENIDENDFVVSDGVDTQKLDEAIKLAGVMFSKKTSEFVADVIENGSIETQEKHGLTPKQFNNKVFNISNKIAVKKANKRDAYILNAQLVEIEQQISELEEIIKIIESDDNLDKLNVVMHSDVSFFDELIFTSRISRPVAIMKQFTSVELKDQYRLTNAFYNKLEELKRKQTKLLNN